MLKIKALLSKILTELSTLATGLSNKVDKTGDTMSGNLNITKSAPVLTMTNTATSGDTMFKSDRTDTDKQVAFGIGGGGTNRGVYIWNPSKNGWLLYHNDNNCYLNPWGVGETYINGHGTYIGYTNAGNGTTSITSGATSKALTGNIQLTEGSWVIVGHMSIPAAASSGLAYLCWYNVTNSGVVSYSTVTQPITSGTTVFTGMQTSHIVKVNTTTNYRLNCYQTSGSTQTVTYYWEIMRIA